MRVFNFVLIIFLAAVIFSCETLGQNSKDNLDWEGQYVGRIPAADGPGINVQITLREDNTFSIVYTYIDKNSIFTGSGKFTWDNQGNIIILNHKDFPNFYRVEEGYLRQLDMEGKKIPCSLAEQYVLKKTVSS